MKKSLSIMFTLLLLFLLPACGGEEEEDDWGNDGDTPSGGDGGNGDNGLEEWKINFEANVANIALDQNNEIIYIAGSTQQSLYSELIANKEIFLAAFNSKGEELWGKQWDINGSPSSVTGVIVAKFNNIYIGGGTHLNPFIMKFASNGTKLWELFPEEGVRALAVDSEGNIYVGHNIIIKYSPDGKEMQRYDFSSTQTPDITTLAVDSEGNIYAGGFTWGNLFADNAGNIDAFLVKIAPDGTQLWGKQWGGGNSDEIFELVIDKDNIYVLGENSIDDEKISKISSTGEKIWEYYSEHTYFGMTINNSNIYLIAGKKLDKINLNGEQIGSYSQMSDLYDVTHDNDGNIYVCGYGHLTKLRSSLVK